MLNQFVSGMKHRCLSDIPNNKNPEWLNGFQSSIEKLAYLEQALTYITFEILAVREFCSNSDSIDFTGKNGFYPIDERFKKDVPIAFARMAINTAVLMATKLYEITNDPKLSKHLRPLMEALDNSAVDALDKRIARLNIEKLRFLRNKVIAHIDTVTYEKIDAALGEVFPNNDVLEFLDILEPRLEEPLMTTHEAIEKILVSLKDVPGYQSNLN